MILFNTAMGDIQIQYIHVRKRLVKALNIVEALTNRSWIQLMINSSHSKFYDLNTYKTYSDEPSKQEKQQILNNDHRP